MQGNKSFLLENIDARSNTEYQSSLGSNYEDLIQKDNSLNLLGSVFKRRSKTSKQKLQLSDYNCKNGKSMVNQNQERRGSACTLNHFLEQEAMEIVSKSSQGQSVQDDRKKSRR